MGFMWLTGLSGAMAVAVAVAVAVGTVVVVGLVERRSRLGLMARAP